MKANTITEKFDLDIKRFYFPYTKELKCPTCGGIITLDMTDSYISYPTFNHIQERIIYCEKCDDEFTIKYMLQMSFTVITDV